MPYTVQQHWTPPNPAGLSRKDRASGTYSAFVPDELDLTLPRLSEATTSIAEDATVALARLDESVRASDSLYLNHLLIRSESISSSWIEGNRLSPKKLAIAEHLRHGDRVALDVIANVRATEKSVDELSEPDRPVTTSDIEDLQHSIEPRLEAGLRTEQNWVGGPGNSPLRADFIPPPPTEVPRLIANLAEFISRTDGNPVIRAAIAHAQFETIHPFIDGNGRTGRALVHTVLKRAGVLRSVLVPISTVFAAETKAYIGGLTAFRRDPPDLDGWTASFAEAVEQAASSAVLLGEDIDALDQTIRSDLVEYRRSIGKTPAQPRAGSVILKVLERLAQEPVVTIDSVSAGHGVTRAAAHRALVELADAGILRKTKNHKGKIVCYSADQHLAYVELVESRQRRR